MLLLLISRYSNVKLKAILDVISIEKCIEIYAKEGVVLKNGQVCAKGSSEVDACIGNSGGTLMDVDSTDINLLNYYLTGLFSFGPSPCRKYYIL